jgi:hypothetical protein
VVSGGDGRSGARAEGLARLDSNRRSSGARGSFCDRRGYENREVSQEPGRLLMRLSATVESSGKTATGIEVPVRWSSRFGSRTRRIDAAVERLRQSRGQR